MSVGAAESQADKATQADAEAEEAEVEAEEAEVEAQQVEAQEADPAEAERAGAGQRGDKPRTASRGRAGGGVRFVGDEVRFEGDRASRREKARHLAREIADDLQALQRGIPSPDRRWIHAVAEAQVVTLSNPSPS